MNNIIEVKNENGELLVSARDLHKGLGIGKDFSTWIKDMIKYGFDENVDFTVIEVFPKNGEKGGRPRKEYIIKLDMAKEICMIQRNDKGKMFRKYFIECEKKLKETQLQLTRKQELQLMLFSKDSLEVVNAHNELVQLEVQEATKPLIDKIEKDALKVDIYDKFLNSNGLYTVTQVAKLYGISSARKLNQLLNEDLHLIYKQGKNWLTYSTTNEEYFKIIMGSTSEGHNYSQLKFTPKGVVEISKLLELDIKEEDLEELI